MPVRSGYSRSCNQPHSRIDSTQLNQWLELVPAHHSHRFVEISDRVLTLPPGGCFDCHNNRRTKRMSVHKRCLMFTKGHRGRGLLLATGGLLTTEQTDLVAAA